MTGINRRAPVTGSRQIEIAAPPALAWDVLTAIDRWPSWNSEIKTVAIDGAVDEGTKFRWRSGPGTITSTIQDVEPPSRIAWTGTTFGIRAIHVHTLEARDGSTVVRTEESYDGLVARIFKGPLKKTLDRALGNGLERLKVETERRQLLR
jgi:uncharacterized protein YndB with AHSA1/START domain